MSVTLSAINIHGVLSLVLYSIRIGVVGVTPPQRIAIESQPLKLSPPTGVISSSPPRRCSWMIPPESVTGSVVQGTPVRFSLAERMMLSVGRNWSVIVRDSPSCNVNGGGAPRQSVITNGVLGTICPLVIRIGPPRAVN